MSFISHIKEEFQVIQERDPAIKTPLEVLLYPSFRVMIKYRRAHKLYLKGHYFLARWISQRAGCVLGFAGVVVINLMGKSLDMGFTLTGEGFILISQVAYGISTILINIYSKKVSPVVLSGTQFTMGGIVLTLIGVGMGGHLGNVTAVGVVIIFYLAMVSAVAYTLWSVLLAWNDVSKVAIFGFVNPLCSVILSALILGEVKQAFNTGSLAALLLVCAGIYIVNCRGTNKKE